MNKKPLLGKKILVVDDEIFLREALSDLAASLGAEVLQAPSGTEAFEIAKRETLDIVFSDIRMPNGDGVSLVKKIKAELKHQPVIFLCSGFSDYKNEDLIELGVKKIFEKPFDYKDLIASLTHYNI